MGVTVIYAIIIFCLLIFVHELGHFIAAKSVGIRVNEFSLGMGPVLLRFGRGETQYSLRALPVGGFVSMEGEDEESNDPRAFNRKSPLQRGLVLVSGSFMNLLTTVILITILALAIGMTSNVIDQVSEGYPAQAAGLKAGDRIIQINETEVDSWSDVTGTIAASKGETITILVERDGEIITLESGVVTNEEGRRVIGITSRLEHSLPKSLKAGVVSTWNLTVEMFRFLKVLFTGGGSMDDLVGPVGIVSIINEQAKMGIFYIVNLTALISLNLAIVNMLPFPALDGGRLLFLIIRQVTGKKITDAMESKIHFAGLMLLFALMIYLVVQDVDRFILK
ncbi:MAG TPA: RIP metalloprotease RseP [Clostridiales bacterium UBA9856]|jgi:regulator of sigma E protease|nr:RIP metalloprotease RseP [Clostridiales bacterium UBA9856]HPZ59663.1 RIP metalloprotease RseP [Bacillota bacterium]